MIELPVLGPREHAVHELTRLACGSHELSVALGLTYDLGSHGLARCADLTRKSIALVVAELLAESHA
jgi:hypothetical protein